jgi:hypothetical protein
LTGPFYEFLPVDHDDEVVVVHELGALRVDARGFVKWGVQVASWRTFAWNGSSKNVDKDLNFAAR